MTLWFYHENKAGYRSSMSRINLDLLPCPTVMAGGIHGDNTSHYWIEVDMQPTQIPPIHKPPYRVPLMAEIAALPWNGLTVCSLFAGAGGSCLGYRMAGYRVRWANEFIPAAQAVYRANYPDTFLDTRDIRTIQPQEILAAIGMQPGELDVLDGSPPCASFSTAGKRAKGWGQVKAYSDTQQRVDDLFFEYVRLLQGLQPKVFVAENVSGLVKGVAKGYFKEILAALKGCGYVVEARLLDAQWLGVPQMRQRIIFVGVRQGLGLAPVFPKPLPYRYTVREALPWIMAQGDNGGFRAGGWQDTALQPSGCIGASPQTGNGAFPPSLVEARIMHDEGEQWSQDDIAARPAPMVGAGRADTLWIEEANSLNSHGLGQHRILDVSEKPMPTIQAGRPVRVGTGPKIEAEADISRYAIGDAWAQLAPGEQSAQYFSLVKPSLEAPCPTITQLGGITSVASVTHPLEKRKFTIAELKRICAFPDDFVLIGSYAQQWERLGRAVPPVMMQAIAASIRDGIFSKVC